MLSAIEEDEARRISRAAGCMQSLVERLPNAMIERTAKSLFSKTNYTFLCKWETRYRRRHGIIINPRCSRTSS